MLSAIISDSLLFKSPTCTEQDVAAARELAAIAGVDADSYGLEMLKAGADLSDKTIAQLISLDAKEFQMGSYKVEIAQVNAVDMNDVLSRQAELEAALNDNHRRQRLGSVRIRRNGYLEQRFRCNCAW